MTATSEAHVREACETGDFDRAATEVVQLYGPEVLGFLHALVAQQSAIDPDDLFAVVCERMWKSISGFNWESSMRTWLYTIARNSAYSAFRAGRARRAEEPVTRGVLDNAVAQVRSTTVRHQQTVEKLRLRALRDALEPDDRTLLILRVDRGMSWTDIVRVLSDTEPNAEDLRRLAAGLRKKFERLKVRLREQLAATAGPT